MAEDFAMVPGVMSAMTGAQQAASAAITSAFSLITPAQLASFSTALGPIGVANMIPAFYEATGNNVTSGMLTAVNHGMLGVSTEAAQASYTKVDDASGGGGSHGQAGNSQGGGFAPDNGAAGDDPAPSVEV